MTEHNLGEKDLVLLYDVLVFGIRKQRKIYGLFREMLQIMDSTEQLLMSDKDFYVNRFCQKYDYRRAFAFKNIPKGLPFEVVCYLRSYKLQRQ